LIFKFFVIYALWFEKHKTLPTVEEIIKVIYGTSELDLDKPENKTQKELVLWYYDRYLPIVAGNTFYGESIRHYKIPVEKAAIVGTTTKVLVTISSEAFGLLSYENCRVS